MYNLNSAFLVVTYCSLAPHINSSQTDHRKYARFPQSSCGRINSFYLGSIKSRTPVLSGERVKLEESLSRVVWAGALLQDDGSGIMKCVGTADI